MKRQLLIFLYLLLAPGLYAQHTVTKRWDARFGGTDMEELQAMCSTNDGGCILAGQSVSGIGGDKTQAPRGNSDYWLVRVDANGHYQWDKAYGGSGDDVATSIIATNDGGYLIGGVSDSDSTGDKTQHSRGGYDFWVVKIDASGTKQWDKRYGGNGDDLLRALKPTSDGGYILAGSTNSGISGDITEANRENFGMTADYWLVKIDGNGNLQWQKRFGGNSEDEGRDVIQTPDGGYLIGGPSESDSSEDKTQNNTNTSMNYWVVKTDSLGNKQWDKTFGGTDGELLLSVLNTKSRNYLLGGSSYSGIGYDKSMANCGYWLIEIDTAGHKVADWAYGTGTNCLQTFKSMTYTSDRGYLLSGWSRAVIGGDKTEDNLGISQAWTLKIDSQMHRVWDKTSLTTGGDEAEGAIQTHDGCYVVGVMTSAGIGGEKTQPSRGSDDYWVVKYCETLLTGISEAEGAMHLTVYPNPATHDVSINIQKDDLKEASFMLTNTNGQIIYQATADQLAHSYTKILDISRLPDGIYMLEVEVDGERIVKKILKE